MRWLLALAFIPLGLSGCGTAPKLSSTAAAIVPLQAEAAMPIGTQVKQALERYLHRKHPAWTVSKMTVTRPNINGERRFVAIIEVGQGQQIQVEGYHMEEINIENEVLLPTKP